MSVRVGPLGVALLASRLFSGLSHGDLDTLEASAVQRDFGRGALLIEEGEEARGLYVVASGRVRVFKASAEGREHVLGVMGPGQSVGEVALFSGCHYPASADALDEVCSAFLSRDAFLKIVAEQPQIALNVIATLSERLRLFASQVEGLSLKEVPARLASYLLQAPRTSQGGRVVELPVPKSQLARLLGTVPETLSRSFAKMREKGLIEVSGPRVTILDENALEDLSAGDKI